jgi:hypothetical protein
MIMKAVKLLGSIVLGVCLVGTMFAERTSFDGERLDMIKEAFRAYAVKNGKYPQGTNAEIVRELADASTGVRFVAKGTDARGNILDKRGHPYLFFFSQDGWVLIGMLAEDKATVEKSVLLPSIKEQPKETGLDR